MTSGRCVIGFDRVLGLSVAIFGLVLGSGARAVAQSEPPNDGDERAAPLGGPRVGQAEGESRTLVRVGYDGRVKELDRPVEAAALDVLELTPAQREAAAGVLAAHARVWDDIVRTRLVDLSRLDAMLNADSAAERFAGLRLALDVLGPVREFGPVRDRVAAVLGEQDGAEFGRVIGDYERALFESRRAREPELTTAAYRIERRIAGILQQLELAFERTLGADEARFERQLAALDLTPRQEQRIRGLIATYGEKYPMGAPKEAERELITKVAGELTLAQRVKFLVMAAKGEE